MSKVPAEPGFPHSASSSASVVGRASGYRSWVLPYDPFGTVRPDRWSIGLRPVDPSDWLVRGGDTEAQLVEKARLLDTVHDACVASMGDGRTEAACDEAAPLVGAALGGPSGPSGSGIGALESIAHRVSEDLVVMMPPEDDGGYVLGAAIVCFPTRWILAEKIGLPMLGVHRPVPGYEPQIGRATNRVFDGLDQRIVLRTNWSMLDSGELHQPSARHGLADDVAINAENAGERVWIRTERQTLRRLPSTGAVLFTIRVFQCRLDAMQPSLHGSLSNALSSVHNDMRTYKDIEKVEGSVVAWLSSQALSP